MSGFITEKDLGQADAEFPGITRFFRALPEKPRTFLDLVVQFQHSQGTAARSVQDASRPRSGGG